MSLRIGGLLVSLAVVSLAMSAAAQAPPPTTPTFTVTVTGPAPLQVTGGQSVTANVDVTLFGDAFGCVQDTPFPVTITTAGGRTTATPGAPELVFQSGMSLYNSGTPAGAYNTTMPASVTIAAPRGVTADFTDTVTVTASFAGGDYGPATMQTCGPGNLPASEGSVAIQVNVRADAQPPPPPGGGSGGGDEGNGDEGTGEGTGEGTAEEEDGSPLSAVLVPVALIGAAYLLRRRNE